MTAVDVLLGLDVETSLHVAKSRKIGSSVEISMTLRQWSRSCYLRSKVTTEINGTTNIDQSWEGNGG